MQAVLDPERAATLEWGRRLEYFTIIWNSLEGLIAIVLGLMAGSIALVGFGLDSAIEVTSGGAALWRLGRDSTAGREHSERITLRIVGWCFVALAAYVAYESIVGLARTESPDRSLPGIALAAVSIIAMPLLARAKRKVAVQIGSAALIADAKQTEFCTYLSAILLSGLALNGFLGWWWADPVAGLLMTPIIAREGFQALRGRTCCHC